MGQIFFWLVNRGQGILATFLMELLETYIAHDLVVQCCGNKMECTRLWRSVNLSTPAPSEWIITITQLCETQWVHIEYITHRPTSSHPPSASLSPPLSPSSETQVLFVMPLSNLVGLADSPSYTDFHLQLTQPRPWPQKPANALRSALFIGSPSLLPVSPASSSQNGLLQWIYNSSSPSVS